MSEEISEEKTAIQKLCEDPKSKNFVNHLIRAYVPINKPTKVWEFEDKKSHKCNVCSHELIDLGTVLGRIQTSKEYAKDFVDNLRKQISGEEVKREDNPIIKHITHGAILAWQGEKTTTFLCADCIKNLLEMVTTALLLGDKNIIWITNQMRRNQVFTHFKESPSLDDKEKEEVKEIQKHADKKKMTFADLGVLQGLKERLEIEEKASETKNE
jgi:hypothetical protein